MFPQVKTQFSSSQMNFISYRNPFVQLPNYEKLETQKMTHPTIQFPINHLNFKQLIITDLEISWLLKLPRKLECFEVE